MNSKDHRSAAEHHVKMRNIHGAALEKCQAMEDGNDAPTASFHKAAMNEHAAMAADHLSMCKAAEAAELSKAAGMNGDGDSIVPDGISVIIGAAPVTPIFRTGQRDFQKLSETVDENLGKVIGIAE